MGYRPFVDTLPIRKTHYCTFTRVVNCLKGTGYYLNLVVRPKFNLGPNGSGLHVCSRAQGPKSLTSSSRDTPSPPSTLVHCPIVSFLVFTEASESTQQTDSRYKSISIYRRFTPYGGTTEGRGTRVPDGRTDSLPPTGPDP